MAAMSRTTAALARGAARPSRFSFRLTRAILVSLALLLAAPGTPSAADASASPQEALAEADRAFHARRYARAAALYRRAAALDHGRGEAALMAAVAAFQLAQYDQARKDLDRALAADLDPEDRALGKTYLSLLAEVTGADDASSPSGGSSADLRATGADLTHETSPITLSLATTLGAGLDSNPQHQGAAELAAEAGGSRAGAPFASGTVDLGLEGVLADDLELEVAYSLEQAAYGDRQLAELDYQDHALAVALGAPIGSQVRLTITAGSDLSLTGLGVGLVPFSRAGRGELDLQLGRKMFQLRLGAGYSATEILDPELAFLSGQRFEGRASPVLSWRGWRLTLTGRLRQDRLGSSREPDESEGGGAPAGDARIPYSNRAGALLGRVSGPAAWRLRPTVWARLERRRYHPVTRSSSDPLPSAIPLGERTTDSAAMGASLRWQLSERTALTAHWDLRRYRASFEAAADGTCFGSTVCGQGVLAARRYHQQTLGLQLQIQWL